MWLLHACMPPPPPHTHTHTHTHTPGAHHHLALALGGSSACAFSALHAAGGAVGSGGGRGALQHGKARQGKARRGKQARVGSGHALRMESMLIFIINYGSQ